MYDWIRAFHLVFMVAWFAGLFYLPRLFVYHADTDDAVGKARFALMERRLYHGIMTPAAAVTVVLGAWLVALRGLDWFVAARWLQLKLVLVVLLVAYHVYLGHIARQFRLDANGHSATFYRWLNEAPLVVLIGAVLLAEIKPWS
jgi:putative membrane protein